MANPLMRLSFTEELERIFRIFIALKQRSAEQDINGNVGQTIFLRLQSVLVQLPIRLVSSGHGHGVKRWNSIIPAAYNVVIRALSDIRIETVTCLKLSVEFLLNCKRRIYQFSIKWKRRCLSI